MKYFVKYRISENISETPEGYLVCIGVPIARTGEMVYGPGETPISDSEKVTIYRDEDEVFNPKTMASFEGKAITIKHPEEFVSPDNWSELAKGVMQNVRRGKGDSKNDLIADLLITDSMAIGLVKNGLREVSCGYEAEYEQTDEDQKNNRGRQKNIIGNHLALVNQGRAGSGYAINDHKGDMKMGLKKKLAELASKFSDEATKLVDEEPKEAAKDEDKKDDAKDESMMDELIKTINELPGKLKDAMKKDDAKDDARGEKVVKEGEAAAGDDEEKKDDAKDAEASVEERLKALETCVQKMMENKAGDEDAEESEDMEDEDKEDKKDDAKDADEESEDDDFENSSMVGDAAMETDTLSRAEILAPGIAKSKDIKANALKKAYETKEGKKVIDSLSGGKAPTFDSKEKVDLLFVAASEVLKASRTQDMANTKRKVADYVPSLDKSNFVTAEMMNEKNAQFYKKA